MFEPEFLENLKEMRKNYDRHSKKFEAILAFLYLYSDKDSHLSEDIKHLFRRCDGHPMQDAIYSTIIYEMRVENWDSSTDTEKREVLCVAGAEMYYLQRKLNICIERTFYAPYAMDSSLIHHIKDEIIYRFPFIADDFEKMEKEGFDYDKEVFYKYLTTYMQNNISEPVTKHGDTRLFINAVQEFFRNSDAEGKLFIKDDKTFWFAVTDKRTKSDSKRFTNLMKDNYGRRVYPTKNDIFVFAIALKLSYEEFQSLIEKAKKDCGNPTKYAFNTTNLRDTLILSVIRDIDAWYEHVMSDCGLDLKSIHCASELLFRVDRLLCENLYHYDDTAQFDDLLYHSFLLDIGCTTYAQAYKEWMATTGPKDILAFQKQAKEAMKIEREASYNRGKLPN